MFSRRPLAVPALGSLLLLHGCAGPAEAPTAAERVQARGMVAIAVGKGINPIEGVDHVVVTLGSDESMERILSPTGKILLEVGELPPKREGSEKDPEKPPEKPPKERVEELKDVVTGPGNAAIWATHRHRDLTKVTRIDVRSDATVTCELVPGEQLVPARAATAAWLVHEGSLRVLDASAEPCQRSPARSLPAGASLVHAGDVSVAIEDAAPAAKAAAEPAPRPHRPPTRQRDADDEYGYGDEDEGAPPTPATPLPRIERPARIFHVDGRTFELTIPTAPGRPWKAALAAGDRVWLDDGASVAQIELSAAPPRVRIVEFGETQGWALDTAAAGVFVAASGPQIVHLPEDADAGPVAAGETRCGTLLTWPSGLAACTTGSDDDAIEGLLLRAPGRPARHLELAEEVSGKPRAAALERAGEPFLALSFTREGGRSTDLRSVQTFALDADARALTPVRELAKVAGISANGRHVLLQRGVKQLELTEPFPGAAARDMSLPRAFVGFQPTPQDSGAGVWAVTYSYADEILAAANLGEDVDYESIYQSLLLVEAEALDLHVEVDLFDERVDIARAFERPIAIPADEDKLLLTFQGATLLPEVDTGAIKTIEDHQFHLEIRDAEGQVLLRTCEGCELGEQRVPMISPAGGMDIAVIEGRPVTLALRYTDHNGSLLALTHEGVVFERRFSADEWLLYTAPGRALLVYLAVLLLTLVCVGVFRQRPRARAVSPTALTGAAFTGILGTSWSGLGQVVSVPVFAALVGASAAGAVLLGLISTTFLRKLVLVEPYRHVAPYIIVVPHVRRRWYAGFLERLRKRMAAESRLDEAGAAENYVPLPADVTTYTHAPGGRVERSRRALARPHEYVRDVVLTRDRKRATVVVIEAPGGRGKSCLKRQIVALLCAHPGATVVPVACSASADGPAADLRAGLGSLGDCDPLVRFELAGGRYVLVYDDAVSHGLAAGHVAEFCERNPAACLIIATREFPGLVRELESVAAVHHVAPRLLSEENLPAFITAYAAPELVEPFRARAQALRDVGGTYLPILIRLGLLAHQLGGESGALSVPAVYDATLRFLLARQYGAREHVDAAIQRLAELCRREYWLRGRPYLDYAGAEREDRELLAACRASGLMVETRGSLRFFHDSIRSYLVACWAARELDPAAGDWRPLVDFLEEVACNPRTRESEIVAMTLAMVSPGRQAEAEAALTGRIAAWSAELAPALSPMNIQAAAPEGIDVEVRELRPAEAIAAVLAAIRDAPGSEEARLLRYSHFFRALAGHIAAAREA